MKCPRCETEHENLDKTADKPTVCIVCSYPLNVDDLANSPNHYTQVKYETMSVILDTVQHLSGKEGYLIGSIIEHLSCYHFKNDKENLEQAREYLSRLQKIINEESKA